MKRLVLKVIAFAALAIAPVLHAEENVWLEGEPSEELFPAQDAEPTFGMYPALWRCDAAPATFGLTTYWIHQSALVACQIAVAKCQQVNGVPCVYRYYRVQ